MPYYSLQAEQRSGRRDELCGSAALVPPREVDDPLRQPRSGRDRLRIVAAAKRPSSPHELSVRETQTDRSHEAIVATVGDHPDDVEAFREHVQDAHKFLTQHTTETNHAMRELLAQFGYTGRQASGFLSSLQRQRDTAGIRNWDQMAEYAASYYPELLAGSNGESTGKGDNEYALFTRLKQGFQPPPSKHAPEVMELAMQMAGPRFLADGGAQPIASETDDDSWRPSAGGPGRPVQRLCAVRGKTRARGRGSLPLAQYTLAVGAKGVLLEFKRAGSISGFSVYEA